ncbi:HNH endonuclease [Sphingorhabdus soli]|uniref:HNH endonuclease n=2 Tax=Flavisphingopyxis soli TaxID=2601267 RepID=A0A5C6UN32_9SPHN|nr:HNH endonuclease [Sphingorhabdus soli]
MGRLTRLPSRIGTLASSKIKSPTGRAEIDAARDKLPWRRWYKTARWQALRWRALIRDAFTCQMCGHVGPSPEMVADHRRPHKGDERLFFDEENVWTLCKTPCHDSVKQREERAAQRR